eukprot:m.271699 g.271699  ORF g.271699 m.271699 type:complete len:312 (+) comp15683_c18_seq4:1738-2673(+)
MSTSASIAATTPSTTTTLTTTTTTTTKQPCNVNECFECSTENVCTICKNAKYLFEGECLDTCPEGFVGAGFGNFRRTCEPGSPAVPCDVDNCYECSSDHVCSICKQATFLLDGVCVDSCPVDFVEEGSGDFNKKCTPVEEVPACRPKVDNCHTCNADQSECIICSGAKYLLDGICVDECPSSSYNAIGSGNFHRRCVSPYACAIDGCHRCDAVTKQCTTCRDEKFLLDGQCVESCPLELVEQGSGTFAKTCEPYVCFNREDGCYSCTDGFNCGVCKNGLFNYLGRCIETCPAGWVGVGRGSFNKLCVSEAN